MKVLILHHIEPEWESAFDRDELLTNVINHIENNHYDRIILSLFNWQREPPYPELKCYSMKIAEWTYAFPDPELEPECYEGWDAIDLKDIIPVTTGHGFAYIYDWIKDLIGCDVYLAGGHRWECLQDLIETLETLFIDYTLIDDCIYG